MKIKDVELDLNLPDYRCYYGYNSGNYGLNALCFTDTQRRIWFFSYKTLVAFRTQKTGLVVMKNVWGNTTGKHLNKIEPNHSKRVDSKTFNALLVLAVKG